MDEFKDLKNYISSILSVAAVASASLCAHAPLVSAEGTRESNVVKANSYNVQNQTSELEKRARVTNDSYILGPGDVLQIELADLPEFSGKFSIGPDGTIYLPRLRGLFIKGFTVDELRIFLEHKYSSYIRDPDVYIRLVVYRPIRVYVGGEVKRPGYYTLRNSSNVTNLSSSAEALQMQDGWTGATNSQEQTLQGFTNIPNQNPSSNNTNSSSQVAPTIYDAIRAASGITPYTDLKSVQVFRKRAEGLGGGTMRTDLNILDMITKGNESQNIPLVDDVLIAGKSQIVLRKQLLLAGQSNLSPQFMQVFVTGRVNKPGRVVVPQGSTLNQAISLAGGTKVLKGKVEFVRFTRQGTIDRRIFHTGQTQALIHQKIQF